LEQARGCRIRSARGYIVVKDGIAVHGETLRGAIQTLSARRRGQRGPVRLDRLPAELLYRRAEAAARTNPDCLITLADARRAGYCDPGIRSYCYQASIGDALVDGQITARRLFDALPRVCNTLAAVLLIRIAESRRKAA
jgi:hypothetical protein